MRIVPWLALLAGAWFIAAPSQAQDQPADSGQRFSPFDFGQINSIGLSLSYFDYNEDTRVDDDIQSFTEHFGKAPLILGAPKSSESGVDFSISGGATFYSWRNRLFLRPRAELVFGINNTYDGSTQGEWIVDLPGDTTGMQYYSYKGKKNNVFIFAGCDLGYAPPMFKFPVVIYTGFDYKWWYRNLDITQDGTYYFGPVSNVETYSWFALPLGVLCTKPVSPDLAIGFDARMDWMFYGNMQATNNTGASDSTVDFPAVTLGNRAAFRLELFALNKGNERASTKYSAYFMYYGFGKSNTATSTTTVQSSPGSGMEQDFFEPTSNSIVVGVAVSFDFLKKRFY
jgi:hypothetical protein